MKKVTVTLEDDVARWVRVHAAERGTSVSRLLGALLKERMQHEEAFKQAAARFLSRKPVALREPGEDLASRAELHDRSGLR